MRWQRLVFWSGFGFLAFIVLAISWLWVADLGSFKPQIERWASQKIGRYVAIDGDLHIDLARHSVVIAENVRIQNAGWAAQADMITVGRIEVRLDLRSLFDGPILIELIDLDDAEFFLTQPEDGDANWKIVQQRDPQAAAPTKTEGRGIIFEQIDIDRVRLVYATPQRTEPLDVFVEFLDQHHRDDDYLELTLDAMVGDRRVRINSRTGTWAAILKGQDINFELDVRLDTFELHSKGWIDDVMNLRRPSLSFWARGPDIDDLTRLLKMGEEGSGDINLAGSLTPQKDGPLVLDVKGNIGRTEIEGSGAFSDLQDLQEIDIDLFAAGPDVRPIFNLAGIDQVRESPFMVKLDAHRQGKSLIIEQADLLFGEARFDLSARVPNFPDIDDSIINLQIEGPDIERFRYVLRLPGAATGPFSIGFTVDVADDGIEILDLDLKTSLGEIKANGSLGPAPDYFGSILNFRLNSDNLHRLGATYGLTRLPDRPIEIVGGVEWTPDGIRTINSLQATVEKLSVRLDGLIKPQKGLFGSDIEFELTGPDLAALVGAFGGSKGVPTQPYNLDGQLQIRNDGFRYRDVTGNIGSSDVQIDGMLVPRRGIVGSRFNIKASGPAFEEVIDQIGDFEVRHGPYDFSGSVAFRNDVIDFDDIELGRPTGKLEFDFELGVPVSRRWANIDIRASGANVRSLLRGIESFEADEAPFLIDVEGTLRDSTWAFDQLDIRVGDASLSAQGKLEFAGDAAATKFSVSANIPSLARLGTLDGHRMRPNGMTLNARVTGGGGVLAIDDMAITFGASDINGAVRYQTGETPRLDIDIESDSIVFAPLLEEKAFEYDAEPVFDDGRVIPDIEIPFEAMKKISVYIDIDIGELQRDALYMRDVKLRLEMDDGVLEIPVVGFRARSGALIARARLAPGENGAGVGLIELVARDFALGMTELNQDMAMTGDIDIRLESTGTDLRSLLGNTDGIFFLNTRGGRIVNNQFMHAIYGDMLDQILSTINPFRESEPYTKFACIVMPIEIVDGVVVSTPNSFVSTDKIHFTLKSVFDLKSEGIEMNIRTVPKKDISISAGELVNPFVKVVGTLGAPRLAVDEKGVLLSGGVAVATGGLSMLARAAWNRLSKSGDPCAKIAEEGFAALSDRFPDLQPMAALTGIAVEEEQQ